MAERGASLSPVRSTAVWYPKNRQPGVGKGLLMLEGDAIVVSGPG